MSTYMTGGPGAQMEMFYYNVDNAFAESVARSLRKGFLDANNYESLKNVSNMVEFKLALEDSDYSASVFENQSSEASKMDISLLRRSMKKKLFEELKYIIGQASYPLNKFMMMMLQGYQIDNVIYMIEGIKNNIPIQKLMSLADPLGEFDELKNV
jgi:vacuolar-type H+-ATPase subunit C/Vma6